VQLKYDIKQSQLTLLQRQSDIAEQTLTFRALNASPRGAQLLAHDENSQYIDLSSSRYLSSTRITKSEEEPVNAFVVAVLL